MIMLHERRSTPVAVKHWSFAGLILTYWCNGRCACCYLNCGPDRQEEMSVEDGLAIWRGLLEASPHGCRVHLTGGEPFGNWPRLIELARRARKAKLGPLQKVETNAFWATTEEIVRERLRALDEAGMEKLCISADPYHQQFVPIERCRLLARLTEDMLGLDRLQVRWADWLKEGFDTGSLIEAQRQTLLASYAAKWRDRLNGRAADLLTCYLERKSAKEFVDDPCGKPLLRSKHVHVDGGGRVMPGTCAGIVLGIVGAASIAEIWDQLNADHAQRPVVGTLSQAGPVGLLPEAVASGYSPKAAYAGKCHLCWDIRRYFSMQGIYRQELSPAWFYGDSEKSEGKL